MCGIVGFSGKSVSGKEIVQCLKQLEYRGYDSSGVATLASGSIRTVKRAGRIINIETDAASLTGTVGIGHTRWATHGAANDVNAHPHSSDQISLVHNGIIENFYSIKSRQPDAVWKTETDTEVILHLLSDYLTAGLAPLAAVRSLVQELRGSFALAIIFQQDPEVVFAVRSGMPLLVGAGDQRHVIASDPVALPNDCLTMAILPEHSITVVRPQHAASGSFSGEQLTLMFQARQIFRETTELGKHEHFMIKEIEEQPAIIRSLLAERINFSALEIDSELAGVRGLNLGKISHIQIVACGTAWHAALLGKYYLESFTQIPVTVELASEFRYSDRPLTSKNLIIAISQSGETADTLSCVNQAVNAKCQILAFCNRAHAEIPRLATKTIHLNCGQEVSVASTKAFLSMIFNFYLFALSCGRNRGQMKKDIFQQKLLELNKIPAAIEQILANAGQIQQVAESLISANAVFFVGRRLSFPIALEGALKLKEISYLRAEGFAAGELKHGPLALIEPGTPVIAIVPADRHQGKTLSNVLETKARGARIITLGDRENQELRTISDAVIDLPELSEDLSPIATAVVVQLLAYYAARKLGTDIDKPRNLAKSVTVE